MEDGGQLIRLFPIPFRLIDDQKQFRKWQWVNCGLAKPPTIGKISRGRTGWLGRQDSNLGMAESKSDHFA